MAGDVTLTVRTAKGCGRYAPHILPKWGSPPSWASSRRLSRPPFPNPQSIRGSAHIFWLWRGRRLPAHAEKPAARPNGMGGAAFHIDILVAWQRRLPVKRRLGIRDGGPFAPNGQTGKRVPIIHATLRCGPLNGHGEGFKKLQNLVTFVLIGFTTAVAVPAAADPIGICDGISNLKHIHLKSSQDQSVKNTAATVNVLNQIEQKISESLNLHSTPEIIRAARNLSELKEGLRRSSNDQHLLVGEVGPIIFRNLVAIMDDLTVGHL